MKQEAIKKEIFMVEMVIRQMNHCLHIYKTEQMNEAIVETIADIESAESHLKRLKSKQKK